MDIVVNIDKIYNILTLPTDILLAKMFLYLGWIPILTMVIWGIWQIWLNYIRGKFGEMREYVVLAVDVPINNEQNPKAIEQLFAHLAGAHKTFNLIETYWGGFTQDYFSFEIVSIEGYIQYIIRCETKYRDFIESTVYAQYPGAEIAEVEDYVTSAPDHFPDDNYDIIGAEWILVNPEVYPIKTYVEFEDKLNQLFKDPMAVMTEMFGSLRKGEQCWFQLIITPTGFDWEKEGAKEIERVIGGKKKWEKDYIDKFTDWSMSKLSNFADAVVGAMFTLPEFGPMKEDEEKEVNLLNMRPKQKKQIEAIQQKISKMAFQVKIRFIYLAEKEIMDKSRFSSFVGYMKQFSNQDVNSFKPDLSVTFTSAHYLWVESRKNAKKNKLMANYKKRSNWGGRLAKVLNIEEMATLWHFPIELEVNAPMLQKVTSRKSEAPSYLPIEGSTSDFASEIDQVYDQEREEIFAPPKAVLQEGALSEFNQRSELAKVVPKPQLNLREIMQPNDSIQIGPPDNLPIG